MNTRFFLFCCALGFIVGTVLMWAAQSFGASAYPTVAQLEQAMNAYPGARIPPQVMANGRVWTGYYVAAKEVGGGVYIVTIKLK